MSDDLISRQAVIDALLHNQEVYANNFGTDAIDKYTIAIIDNDVQTIAQLPSAERRGNWKWSFADNGWADWECSVCGWTKNVDVHVNLGYKFCPNCGARMEDVDDE